MGRTTSNQNEAKWNNLLAYLIRGLNPGGINIWPAALPVMLADVISKQRVTRIERMHRDRLVSFIINSGKIFVHSGYKAHWTQKKSYTMTIPIVGDIMPVYQTAFHKLLELLKRNSDNLILWKMYPVTSFDSIAPIIFRGSLEYLSGISGAR